MRDPEELGWGRREGLSLGPDGAWGLLGPFQIHQQWLLLQLMKLLVPSGLVWSGLVRSGLARFGQVRSDLVKCGLVRSGQVRSGLVWSGQVRSGLV